MYSIEFVYWSMGTDRYVCHNTLSKNYTVCKLDSFLRVCVCVRF